MLEQRALRVFVVDDEALIASTLTVILRRSGYLVTSFTNPLDVLRSAAQDVPDVLISDVLMPTLSGVELAIQVTRKFPHCRILLMSGLADFEDLLVEARKQRHAFPLLCKPVHPTEILRRLSEHCDEYATSRASAGCSVSTSNRSPALLSVPLTGHRNRTTLIA